MPCVRIYFQDKRYRVDLDPLTGEVEGYAVEVSARGKATTERNLWRFSDRRPMPQRLKDITNQRGFSRAVAYVMGWEKD